MIQEPGWADLCDVAQAPAETIPQRGTHSIMDADRQIYYEHPLTERVRTFLRLEFLFKSTLHYLKGRTLWDSRAALQGMLEILSILGRNDLKAELLKELERHASNLAALRERPGVDRQRLAELLQKLTSLTESLYGSSAQFALELRENDFLASIRQRSAIPGGTCEFDMPGYHYWLQQEPDTRYCQLRGWFDVFEPLYQPITLILFLIRQSAEALPTRAERGFFQQNLDPNTPCLLMRVALPADARHFPEISGGRHRFTIRFWEQESPVARAIQTARDVDFGLACCAG
ncbi:MAG: hypothetical protein B7Z66_01480 [Chromatiales bacterium 21-64-14]|nr:MAG: hypothetical protein B7Z66_01480 [Chromatiales bacterium 21-64-14]HQU14885.1 cell division protein ZapD [Gammaproteobacteria bacterium]